MKHHVILMTESLQIPGTYLVEEYNVAADEANEVLYRGIDVDASKLTLKETRDYLGSLEFIKREFVPPSTPKVDPELIKEIGGQASITELLLAGTAVITIFFFRANSLPWYQKVYELKLPEE